MLHQSPEETGIQGCALDETNIKYPKCICKVENSKSCKPVGQNSGIEPNDDAICTDLTADASGNAKPISKYTQCKCSDEFIIPASTCDDDTNYFQDSEPYCDLYMNEGVEEAPTGKYYKRCFCDPKIYDNSKDMQTKSPEEYCSGKTVFVTDTEIQSCDEIVYDADTKTTKTIRRPNKNLCCTSTVDSSYTQLSSANYGSLAEFFEYNSEDTLKSTFLSNCGHAYNADIMLDCDGTPYYKCLNTTVANDAKKGTIWYSKDECAALNKGRETQGTKQSITGSWLEDVEVYPDCDCNSKYKYTDDTQCGDYYTSNKDKLYCTYAGQNYTTKVACKSYDIFKIYQADHCEYKDGSIKYARCVCKLGGESINANGCISAYCGNPSKNDDPNDYNGGGGNYACWISGINAINGGKAIRVSVFNGKGSGDKSCKCPTARIDSDVNGCSGGAGVKENITTCKYPAVVYTDN